MAEDNALSFSVVTGFDFPPEQGARKAGLADVFSSAMTPMTTCIRPDQGNRTGAFVVIELAKLRLLKIGDGD